MKFRTLRLKPLAIGTLSTGVTTLALLSLMAPAQAENVEHTRQLLATKECAQCDLSGVGLVFADLSNANLVNANLSGANLSRANLQGADLRGANLAQASLAGANLFGAKLDNANLSLTDLRGSYLIGATWEGTITDNVLLQGAIGLPISMGNPNDFYRWAMAEADQKNFARAVENFTQVLQRKPDFAQAYLGRAMARLQSGDSPGAIQDAKQAEVLFARQGNTQGAELAQKFTKELTTPPPEKKQGSNLGSSIVSAIGTILQLLIP